MHGSRRLDDREITVVGKPSALYVRPYCCVPSIQIGKRIPNEPAKARARCGDSPSLTPTTAMPRAAVSRFRQALKIGHFGAAGRTPRCPQVHHDQAIRDTLERNGSPAIVA